MSEEHSYRDRISTISEDGKRVWIYPKQPKGKFYTYRKYFSALLLGILFTVPFIQYDGHPIFLFNILERKFILFGFVFWPQDFHLFVLAMISFMIFIVLFTVVYGRIWCGWACPQTLFMEMVFRRIEYWIEGNHKAQKKLKVAPWTANKIFKKLSKQLIFVAISFLIANTLLAYVIGVDELKILVTDSPLNHMKLFTAVIAFTGVFYAIFSFFREQACTVVCPYGRLQGVFLDNKSIAVSYDFKRGEPRGKISKKDNNAIGDCVDCGLCVQVCPTGIDIRNGLQLECVNCTACIDACDEVMEKTKRPKGLIRYASKHGIITAEGFKLNPRIIAYSALLLVLLSTLSFLFVGRGQVETTLLRSRGFRYGKIGTDSLSNLYNYQIVNKHFEPVEFEFRVDEPEGVRLIHIGLDSAIQRQEIRKGVIKLIMPRSQSEGINTKVLIGVYNCEEKLDKVKTNFLGPSK